MTYLFMEMLILHLIAFLIGIAIAWLIWGRRAGSEEIGQ